VTNWTSQIVERLSAQASRLGLRPEPPQSPPPQPRAPRRLMATLRDDVQVVASDMKRRGFWRAFGDALAGIEAFYLTDDDRRELAALHGIRRFVRRVSWLVAGLLMKLTPARRIMLAVALWCLFFPLSRIDIQNVHLSFRAPAFGGLCLLAVLMLELKDKLVARDELEAGRVVQLALMPGHSPAIPGWELWLYTQPANDVGGDLVDHLQIDEHHHFVALGDVAGKALPAALLSVKLQATLRALAPGFDDLGAFGAAVNQILYRDGLPARFASLVYLVLTVGSGQIRVLNAGHMPPLVVSQHAVSAMDTGSMVLGIMPGPTFSEQRIDLLPGDTLVVYSDGITEAMNEADDFFGDDRLIDAVRRSAGLAAGAMGARVLDDVSAFVGDAVRSDDVSLIVLRRL
jgi:hypothetical protein